MKSKTNYLEHISLNSEKGIRESLLDNANTKIYYVTSDYEAKYILLNTTTAMRVWIDKTKQVYLIGSSYETTHVEMVNEALKEGLDIKFDDFDKNQICIIYVPQEDKDFDVYEDAIVDDYDTEYDYKKGMKVYSRYNDFSQFKLCNLLGEYTKHKLIKEDYVRPTKMYDIKDGTAEFSKEGADWVWWDSEAKFHKDYANAYRVKMSPEDYLDLTTSKGAYGLSKGMSLGGTELKDLDIDEFNKETYQPIFLIIEFTHTTSPYTADVIGHEGRHRMFALWQAGVNKVDVQIRVSEENYDKYNPYKVDRVTLKGQFSPYRRVTISGLVPMSWAEHKKIRPDLESVKEGLNESTNLKLNNCLKHYFGNRRKRVSNPPGSGVNRRYLPHVDYDINKKNNVVYHVDNSDSNELSAQSITNRFEELFEKTPYSLKDETTFNLVISIINYICDSESENFYSTRRKNNEKAFNDSAELVNVVKDVLNKIAEGNSLGESLSTKQEDYFKNSKIRDNKGNLIPVYHGSKEKNIKVFDPRKGKSQFGDYKFGNAVINYFTKDKETAIGYTEMGREDDNVYEVYLNIENPYVVNNETVSDIKSHSNIKDKKLRDKQLAYFDRIWNKWNNKSISEDDLEELNKDLFYLGFEIKSTLDREEANSNYGTDEEWYDLYKLDQNTKFGKKHIVEYSYSLEELFDNDMYDTLKSDIIGEDKEDYYFTTDDIVKMVLLMNEEDGTDYDGIIIPDISDIGPTGSLFSNITTDYVTLKSSNQIKSVNNLNPTSSNRIDESNTEKVVNEDIDYNDIYKSMVFETSPKLGPIFINKDGKFYNVGKEKAHSSIFGNEEWESEDYYALEDNFGLIKANGGNKLETFPYIDLWIMPNKEQQRAILEWLDLLVVSGRKSVYVNNANFDKEYSFTEYTADEILKDVIRMLNKVQEDIDKISKHVYNNSGDKHMKEKEQKTTITEATEITEIDDESIGEALREIECGECTIVSSVEEMWKALGIKL